MNNLSNFGENLRDIMFDNKKTVKQACQETGLSASQFYRWQRNSSVPSLKHLAVLAKYFCCTVDYLLDRENERLQLYTFKPTFSERLKFLIEKKGVTAYRVYTELNISSFVFYSWMRGKYTPLLDNILKLAKYFECSTDYLIGIENR